MQIDETGGRQARVQQRRGVCGSVSICDVSVCVLAWMRRPRLLSLIDPAQHPSDLQDISALGRGWWRWRDGERERCPGRKGEERKIKINSAESITQNLTGRETEIVKSY